MKKTIILYPRSYNKRGEESRHSVFGVDEIGSFINIKLRVPDLLVKTGLVPSIAEFSRDDRKAKLACQAHEMNGPENRHGVLLFSNCELESKNDGVETWVSKWANVLSVDSDSPHPFIGFGRISINKKTNNILTAKRNLERMEREGLVGTEEYEQVKALSEDKAQYHYSAVLYDLEEKKEFTFFDKELFLPIAEESIDKNNVSGITGGFYVCIKNSSGEIKEFEIFSKYVVGIQRYQTGLESAKSFLDSNIVFFEKCLSYTVIPLRKINSGPRGNIHFGQDHKYDQIVSLFGDGAERYSIRKIAVRVSYFEDSNNTLLSRYYALDEYAASPNDYECSENFDNQGLLPYDAELRPSGFIFDHLHNTFSSLSIFLDSSSEEVEEMVCDPALPEDSQVGVGLPGHSTAASGPLVVATDLSPRDDVFGVADAVVCAPSTNEDLRDVSIDLDISVDTSSASGFMIEDLLMSDGGHSFINDLSEGKALSNEQLVEVNKSEIFEDFGLILQDEIAETGKISEGSNDFDESSIPKLENVDVELNVPDSEVVAMSCHDVKVGVDEPEVNLDSSDYHESPGLSPSELEVSVPEVDDEASKRDAIIDLSSVTDSEKSLDKPKYTGMAAFFRKKKEEG